MFNYLLDRLPEDYEGYLIRTDFRIGIQIMLCLEDKEFTELERYYTAFDLLYGSGMPLDMQKCSDGLVWFLTCGKVNKEHNNEVNEKITDFDYDSIYLYSAFKKAYNIDLKTAKLHWWEFQALVGDLGECAYTNIIKIRNKKMSECSSAEERMQYKNLKEMVKLPGTLSEEDREALERFREISGEDFEID